MIFWIFLALFVIGTLILARSKVERYAIVFLIRTKYFINFIDRVACISPRFWKFLADFAIVLSFSGLGAAYLSRYRRLSRNLDVILILFGLLAIVSLRLNLFFSLFSLVVLFMGVRSLSSIKNPNADFLVATTLISVIGLNIFPGFIAVLEGMFGLLVLVFAPLIENALAIGSGESTTPGVSPVILIPVEVGGEWCFPIPGVGICIPVFYAVPAFILLLMVHEFAHGILIRAHKLKLKSTGLVTIGVMPLGAFVEPDEEDFRRSDSLTRTRVLSMGSFANINLALVTFVLFLFIALPSTMIVAESSVPHLDVGTRIEAIGDTPAVINRFSTYLFHSTQLPIENSVEDGINITTDKGTFFLGMDDVKDLKVSAEPHFRFNYLIYGVNIFQILTGILFWSFFFNINIGLINLLPIPPFDGGKMFIELMSVFNISKAAVTRVISLVILIGLLILLVNAFPLLNLLTEYIDGLIGGCCG